MTNPDKTCKVVFLDRDGTLNVDPGYISDPLQMELLPDVGDALVLLKKAGFLLVVVTNQSGVARGLIDEAKLPLIHDRPNQLLKPKSVHIDYFEVCTHHPVEGCECRKPKPKLLIDFAKKFNANLSASYMVGDRLTDLEVGRNAGTKVALVRTGNGLRTETEMLDSQADFVGDTLMDVAKWIASETVS